MNILELNRRQNELAARAGKALADYDAGRITAKAFDLEIGKLEAEDRELQGARKALGYAQSFGGSHAEGEPSSAPTDDGRRLSFKGMGSVFAKQVGPDGITTKALAPSGATVVAQEFAPSPVSLGQPATGLLDVVPVKPHSTGQFSYLRQTVRTNNAAKVADHGLKPTSVFTVERIEDQLDVIAHLSEPIPRFWLKDNEELAGFIANELTYGLRVAVEQMVLDDINATSGLQTQAYATSPLVTLRKSLTKLENNGLDAGAIVLAPVDWEAVELLLTTTGATDVQGIPYDAATRRLFGVPVAVTVAADAGFGHVLGRESVMLDTGEGVGIQWSENAGAETFARNEIVARCEGRYATSVFRPLGVVVADLTA